MGQLALSLPSAQLPGGHLMPGSEAEGAALLDAFLDGRSKDSESDDE